MSARDHLLAEWRALTSERTVVRPGDGGLQVAALVIAYMAASYALADVWMIVGGTLVPWAARAILIGAAAIALAVGWLWAPARLWRSAVIVAVTAVATAIAAAWLVDVTYDGQDYHYTAIWALANGWNPYHNWFSSFVAPGSDEEMWAWHFPKAHWLFGALQVAAGLSYEAAKTQTVLMMLASAGAAYGIARRIAFGRIAASLLALLCAANPIAVQESFARMNDGVMVGYVVCFLAFAACWVVWGERRGLLLVLVVIAVALNSKQSAILILAILCAGLCAALLMRRGSRAAAGGAALLAGWALFALFVVGADPYLRNTIKNGNPVYPLRGAPNIVIDDEFRPPALAGHSDPVRLALSLAGRTSYTGPTYKPPFAVDRDELVSAGDAEVFLAGFGPWFSAALVFGLAAGAVVLWRRPKKNSRSAALAWTALVVAVSAFAMPENWAVRYVPQLWLVPLLLMVAAALCWPRGGRWLLVTGAAVMAVDAAMVAGSLMVRQVGASRAIHAQAARLVATPGVVSVDLGASPARLAVLQDAGLRVMLRVGPDPRCTTSEAMRDAYDYEAGKGRPATICRPAGDIR